MSLSDKEIKQVNEGTELVLLAANSSLRRLVNQTPPERPRVMHTDQVSAGACRVESVPASMLQ